MNFRYVGLHICHQLKINYTWFDDVNIIVNNPACLSSLNIPRYFHFPFKLEWNSVSRYFHCSDLFLCCSVNGSTYQKLFHLRCFQFLLRIPRKLLTNAPPFFECSSWSEQECARNGRIQSNHSRTIAEILNRKFKHWLFEWSTHQKNSTRTWRWQETTKLLLVARDCLPLREKCNRNSLYWIGQRVV